MRRWSHGCQVASHIGMNGNAPMVLVKFAKAILGIMNPEQKSSCRQRGAPARAVVAVVTLTFPTPWILRKWCSGRVLPNVCPVMRYWRKTLQKFTLIPSPIIPNTLAPTHHCRACDGFSKIGIGPSKITSFQSLRTLTGGTQTPNMNTFGSGGSEVGIRNRG